LKGLSRNSCGDKPGIPQKLFSIGYLSGFIILKTKIIQRLSPTFPIIFKDFPKDLRAIYSEGQETGAIAPAPENARKKI
jgi:hypothetical protein